jgi:hypothetical protein
MIEDSRVRLRVSGLSPKPASMNVWHMWTIIMPRRSITGRLLFGQVWRRRDGRHWVYKKFIKNPGRDAPRSSASGGAA